MNTPADLCHVGCAHCGATNRVPRHRLTEDPVCGRCGRALLDGHPLALTDANFDAVLRATELPVVVDFWADWCGPCRMMAPQFERAAAALKGQVLFVKVDSDANPGLSARYAIRSIPTLLKLQGGREVARAAGARSAEQIVAWVRSAG